MNKRQYLESLREYLSFELPERLVKKNLDFYEEYFEQQMREGKSADQICEELGDAQLIARSCIEAEKAGADGIPDNHDDNSFEKEMYAENQRTDRSYTENSRTWGSNQSFGQRSASGSIYEDEAQQAPKLFQGAGCLLTGLILLGLVCLVVAFFSSSFGSILLTILVIVGLFKAITKLFRG